MLSQWTIVIPVKGTPGAKSRLGAGPALAEAIALDTVEAALAVAAVIVVTPSGREFEALGARVVADPGGGLAAAVEVGIASARGNVAVLLGDLPALQAADLRAALDAASTQKRSFVPDREGTGTVLIASTTDHAAAFGEGSAQRHRDAGYVELDVDPDSALRSDVDTVEQLERLGTRVGKRTTAQLP